jgi:Recombinase zinc beta ribbon domain
VEPARRVGYLGPARATGARQRGRFHRRPGHQRRSRPAPAIAPAAPGTRRYLLAGLLACGTCGRRTGSAWSNGKAAYRCRHGHTSAAAPDPTRPKNAYIREDRILTHLPALHLLLVGTQPARRRRTRRGADTRPQAGADDVIR